MGRGSQEGYFNPKPFSKFSEYEKKLHLIDLALGLKPHFQIPIRFSLKVFPYSNGKKPNLIIISKISGETIQEISGKKVEIANLIFDKNKNLVELKKDRGVDLSSLKGNAYYYSVLSLSPGEYEFRVVLRNLQTGRGAVASKIAVIPEYGDSGLKCDSLLLLKPEKRAFHINTPFDSYQFDSSQYAPLVESLDKNIFTLLGVLKCSIPGIKEPKINIYAYLTDYSSGERFLLSLSTVATKRKKDEYDFLVKLQLPRLLPGRYGLSVITEELKTESQCQVYSDILVQ